MNFKKQGRCFCGGSMKYLNAEFNEGVVEVLTVCDKCFSCGKEIYTTTYQHSEIDVEAEKAELDNQIAQTLLEAQHNREQAAFYNRELDVLYKRRAHFFDLSENF